jgi:hypothetical protein
MGLAWGMRNSYIFAGKTKRKMTLVDLGIGGR